MTITNRPRRMRQNDFSRKLMRENNLSVSHLIYPVFVIDGNNIRQDISSMPGIQRLSIDLLLKDAQECFDLGIPAIVIFPVIDDSLKSHNAKECFNESGLIPKTVKALKKAIPKLGVITDIALDPYTSHGQDGLIDNNGDNALEICKRYCGTTKSTKLKLIEKKANATYFPDSDHSSGIKIRAVPDKWVRRTK